MSGLRRSNSSAIGKLFLNGKYSDLVIRCQGTDFRVHRAIVCPQCAFFDAACSGGQEEYEGVIELPEDHPDIVQKLLEFLYTEDVADPRFLESSPTSPASRSSPRLGFQLAIAGLPADEHHHQEQQGSAGHLQHQQQQHSARGQRHARSHHYSSAGGSSASASASSASAAQPSASSDDAIESLYLYMRLYAIADKYDVPGLADLAGFSHHDLCHYRPTGFGLRIGLYTVRKCVYRVGTHPELAVGVLDRVLGITDQPPDMGFLPP
ncbi:hypothetical protein MAPG_04685 [Magnaporthiopsis poae ATCC 64411]|uniref:BTB domain-containing protein n=1 Tax=Magnaporthiopsis poae (strain ATCC 64411 / 73-15) TaxID=644358 RepID=A0A0C4DXE0_MAGP6|nr:hypothetical protein MAPG_04685 [Magnaporthiopsis poae ATCC 64411]